MRARMRDLVLSLVVVALLAVPALAVEGDEHWSPAFALPGADGTVVETAPFAGDLIIGGNFQHIGTTAANRVARWDGSAWHALGDGFDDSVLAIAEFNGELYAAGKFGHSGDVVIHGMARWDGAAWQPLAEQLDWYSIEDLAVYKGRLIAGGRADADVAYEEWFEVAGLAAWDGAHWVELAEFEWGLNCAIYSMATIPAGLIVAGTFSSLNGDYELSGLARWDGDAWHSMGDGLGPYDRPLVVVSDQLFAPIGRAVYGWDGANWVRATDDFTFYLRDLTFHDGHFVACYMTLSPGITGGVVRWDGADWIPLGGAFQNADLAIPSLAMIDSWGDLLLAGGYFSQVDGVGIPNLAVWDGVGWRECLDTTDGQSFNGLDDSVFGLGSYEGDLMAAGTFDFSWQTPLFGLGRWTGMAWEGFNTGLTDREELVRAVVEYQGNLVVTGEFSDIGGVPTANMATWTGSEWLPFGEGQAPQGWTLLADGSDLYVGGWFTAVGGAPAGRIARWDGGSWSSLAGGFNASVAALTLHEGALIAGGSFTADSSGHPLGRIARWDGSAWMPLGTGLNNRPTSLASWRGQLVAGGLFTLAGGQPADGLASWDGQSWHALPAGPDTLIAKLAVYHDDLIVAGGFTELDGRVVNGIVRWDGSNWSPLGSGFTRIDYYMLSIHDLTVLGDELYVTGSFRNAGGKASFNIACWTDGSSAVDPGPAGAEPLGVWNYPNPFNPSTELVFTLPAAAPVSLRIVDASGRLVRTLLADAPRLAGEQRVTWDGRDDAGRRLPSGAYLYELEAGGRRAASKMLLLK